MVSDFFFPSVGGVESHIFCLGQKMIERGNSVIVITRSFGNRCGKRILLGNLVVYYIPLAMITSQCSFPSNFASVPLFLKIANRHSIQLVHCHQSYSSLAHAIAMLAKILGLRVIFTDHSLSALSAPEQIVLNKMLQLTLIDCDQTICVSHTAKQNIVLRGGIDCNRVYVIPNALDSAGFRPASQAPPIEDGPIIVVCSRLVYRKGTDLLVQIIPIICKKFSTLKFLIAGDGPKKVDLEQMLETEGLQQRVALLGPLPHNQVRNLLVRGHIFLNTSLTEAFCIAIVEATSCGLLVVSTDVGGIPEVLPDDLVFLASPTVDAIVSRISDAIDRVAVSPIDAQLQHERVAKMYSWDDVAERTERVYRTKTPALSLTDRLRVVYALGPISGKIFCLQIILCTLWVRFLQLTAGDSIALLL